MKFSVIADLHLSITDSMSKLDAKSGVAIRTLDRLKALDEALKLSIQNDCEKIFLAGDIYDKLNPPENLKKLFIKTIKPYLGRIEIVILPGNHDGSNYTHNYLSEKEILKHFDKNNQLRIIDEIESIYSDDGKSRFLLIPWTTNLKIIEQKIKEEPKGSYCIGHLEISGAVSSTEYELTSGINPKLFDKFIYTYLGHYHRRQVIKNIEYVGSPIIKDFSELEIEKGFIVHDTDTEAQTFYLLEKRQAYNFIINEDTLDEVAEFLENNTIPEGSMIKVTLEGTEHWISEVEDTVKEVFQELKPLKFLMPKTTFKEVDNKVDKKILKEENRINKIKLIAEDEDEESLKFGINLYREAENEYYEIIQ